MKKQLLVFGTGFTMVALTACGTEETEGDASSSGDDPIQVVSTIGQLDDAVTNIGGDLVDNHALMGPGIDPHMYNASQGDVQLLDDADIVFYNGLNLEANMEDILEQMGQGKPVYAVGNNVPEDMIKADEEEQNMPDPHIWFDIDLWSYAVEEVRDGLIELDPDNEDVYTENAETYLSELTEVQEWAYSEIEQIEQDQRVLVTAHDAFQYFGDAFDFDVLGLQGISTEAEYGLSDVQRIIDEMIERDITAVFGETSVSDSAIEAVIQGAGQQGHDVEHGGELYSDAMGEEGTEEGTYIGMYRANVSQVVDALK
ncbi:metal ABC transporter solute-binding protein, Zn/Mn family [Geomicrobium sp. JCM 19039]|uniref:metal ABC transporter solute-binding protein, Zn/Mn family n=1 Tax=Geomicrobium sp. JCM 19039 TaxID=1460636 RepID=UPI00045F18C1|nr:zinc ABC transporter substrate-binding protein [Geomicrobium sp. JCM 19039]GAK11752.1 manganese ABC transporter, periplasmic-binding protein SitA [Geomicrobium sp. JCM 19039]